MSNEMFPLSRQAFADGELDFTGDDWRVALMSDAYVYDEGHEFYSDVTADALAISANITGKSNVFGVCDASDVTFPAVAGGDVIGSIILYQWTGSDATSRVVIFYDTLATAEMISVSTDGLDVIVRWSNGSTKMFRV